MNAVPNAIRFRSIRQIMACAFFAFSLNAAPAWGGAFSYGTYTGALANVDDRGLVDYGALKADRGGLDAFVESLAAMDKSEYDGWGEKERIAFWINAYNGLTLKAIIDHYPIKPSKTLSLIYPESSIRQIPGVWKKLTFDVMGEPLTLDHIEHQVLRKEFNEPRIHMALVCAAISCPSLRNEPFTGDRLDGQLDDQTRRFLAAPGKFRIDRDSAAVHLSAIFKWFGDDFVEAYGVEGRFLDHSEKERAVLNFISRYLSEGDAAWLESKGPSIEHLKYDWTLNGRKDG